MDDTLSKLVISVNSHTILKPKFHDIQGHSRTVLEQFHDTAVLISRTIPEIFEENHFSRTELTNFKTQPIQILYDEQAEERDLDQFLRR